ncbi:MAG: flagellar biosynthetic protein FliR, partial [Phycisphaerae bacterium]|nr:flagellar biosynthetic protein FliR [Phycisphaerae bacterium]
LAIVIFLAIGGHRVLIAAVLKTFDTVPVMSLSAGGAILKMIVALLGTSFALALKVAAPAIVALLLATVAMGLLQKTMPQFNLFSTGLPIRALLGLLALAAALAYLPALLGAAWEGAAGEIIDLVKGLR